MASRTSLEVKESIKKEEILKWLLSLDPSLQSTLSLLSSGSFAKLEKLYIIHQKANAHAIGGCSAFKRCSREYSALAEKLLEHLGCLVVDQEDSPVIEKNLQEISDIIISNNVGNGTESDAVIELVDHVLASTKEVRQQMGMRNDIRTHKNKNTLLVQTLNFYSNELKNASEEVLVLESEIKISTQENSILQAQTIKHKEGINSIKAELEKEGVSSSISNQEILNTYKSLTVLEKDVQEIEGKLKKQFDDFPPCIPEAVERNKKMKGELSVLTNEVKNKLLAFRSSAF